MVMCDIYTQPQPTLKTPDIIIYQVFILSGSFESCINAGYVNIPIKLGITMIVPMTNQGNLFPHGVFTLSLMKPRRIEVMPSAIYPEIMQ